MSEMETLFATSVWTKLKEKYKGRIFCKVIDGTLQVSIKCYDIVFRMNVEDVANKLVLGEITSDSCAMTVSDAYRRHLREDINKRYFY